METVAKQRVELSPALSEFGETIEALSGTDISSQLAGTLQNLAAVQNKAKKLQDDQAQQDVITFAGTGTGFTPSSHLLLTEEADFGYSSRGVWPYDPIRTSTCYCFLPPAFFRSVLLNPHQGAFASRIKCYGQWQSAENDIRRVKSLGEKARRQGRNHAQDVAEAERKATLARQDFEKVTRLLKIEMHRFDMERVEDFKKSLEAFLEGMIMRQRQVRCSSYVSHLEWGRRSVLTSAFLQLIKAWESYQELLLQKGGTNPKPGISQGADSPDVSHTAPVVD